MTGRQRSGLEDRQIDPEHLALRPIAYRYRLRNDPYRIEDNAAPTPHNVGELARGAKGAWRTTSGLTIVGDYQNSLSSIHWRTPASLVSDNIIATAASKPKQGVPHP